VDKSTPTTLTTLTSSVTQIVAGAYHNCALLSSGGVKCWGDNPFGQLGDGTTITSTTPKTISTLTAGVTQLAAGDMHTCALLSTGGVKCWGDNYFGQIGDGTGENRTTPTALSTLTSGVTQIAIGGSFTCALLSTGGIKCWGWNVSGQLGDGTTTDSSTPTSLSTLTAGVTQIGLGGAHSCAILSSGGVKCWGENSSNELGDGTTTNRSTPVDISIF
jgi:alpha-tubulin suppressor-like RCC1 family protein